MALYFVRHQHNAETCPARDPQAGDMLLAHLSPLNARQQGIEITSDAVLDGQHTFVLIVNADSRERVENFIQPFRQAGSVEIIPSSHCETVVERQGC